MSQLDAILKQFGALQDRLSEIEQRKERHFRFGTTSEIDPINKLVRSVTGVGADGKTTQLSPWMPYMQMAGFRKHHSMLSPPTGTDQAGAAPSGDGSSGGATSQNNTGQQLMMISTDGDFNQMFAIPFTWSNANPAPSNDPKKDVDERTDPSAPTQRSVWWQKAGDVQQQVVKTKWHVTQANHHHRVGDSRDGADSLQQELKPQQQNAQDQVHYGDLDSNGDQGGNGYTKSILNDKHKITVHPQKGVQAGVNFQQTQQSTPGPGTDTGTTHKSLWDLVAGIVHSVQGGLHKHSLNPTTGILSSVENALHTHSLSKLTGIISSVQNALHTSKIDPTSGILHSVFGGAHTINLGSAGINLTSALQVQTNAPLTIIDKLLKVDGLTSLLGGLGTGAVTIAPDADGGFANVSMGLGVQGGLTTDTLSPLLQNFANDAAAIAGGVQGGQLYRNGNLVMILVGTVGAPASFGMAGSDATLEMVEG